MSLPSAWLEAGVGGLSLPARAPALSSASLEGLCGGPCGALGNDHRRESLSEGRDRELSEGGREGGRGRPYTPDTPGERGTITYLCPPSYPHVDPGGSLRSLLH